MPALLIFVAIAGLWLLANMVYVFKEYERGVVFRWGRLLEQPKGPGLAFVIPMVDRVVRISLRTIVLDIPPQDIITQDNVSVQVNAVLYFRVMDPNKAVTEIEDYIYATSQLAQTTLRSVLGEVSLQSLLSDRENLNNQIQEIVDKHTDPWGMKVSMVEVKHVDLPESMKRAMARTAEADREAQAKVIHAAGELRASTKLAEAAEIVSQNSVTIQLRYLQTLTEIATEKNSTIIFPLPVDLLAGLMNKLKD